MTVSARARLGAFLFRWRSYAPLLLLFPGFLALSTYGVYYESNFEQAEDAFTLACFLVSMLGLAVRWVTVGFVPQGTSGRNTRAQRAHTLNTTGMYSVVRNPLYLGNFLAILGIVLAAKAWWFPLLTIAAYWVFIAHVIAAEEAYLLEKFGQDYASWRDRTPAFLPNPRLWQAPELEFSLKTVLRREPHGLMAVCSAFFVIEFLLDVVLEHEPLIAWLADDWMWVGLFAVGTVVFVTLRTLKKHTQLLVVSGR